MEVGVPTSMLPRALKQKIRSQMRAGTSSSLSSSRSSARRELARRARQGMVPSYVGSMAVGRGLGSVAERKSVDIAETTYNLSTTSTACILLNGLYQGSQSVQRIGRKVRFTSLQIRGFIFPQSATTVHSYNRMVVLYDRQANGALPNFTDVFQDETSAAAPATSNTPTCFINLNNRDRFVVLSDRSFCVGAVQSATGYTGSPTTYPVDLYRKINLETQFNGANAGTVGDITTGSIICFMFGTGITTQGAAITCSFRMRFLDL